MSEASIAKIKPGSISITEIRKGVLYQASSRAERKNYWYARPPLRVKRTNYLPGFLWGSKRLKTIALPGLLYSKYEHHVFTKLPPKQNWKMLYQASCRAKMKKNYSTKPPLEQQLSFGLPGLKNSWRYQRIGNKVHQILRSIRPPPPGTRFPREQSCYLGLPTNRMAT